MISLYKCKELNARLREIITDIKTQQFIGIGMKHKTNDECCLDIVNKYKCSYSMAKKVVYIVRGDAERQIELNKTFGSDYALYECSFIVVYDAIQK